MIIKLIETRNYYLNVVIATKSWYYEVGRYDNVSLRCHNAYIEAIDYITRLKTLRDSNAAIIFEQLQILERHVIAITADDNYIIEAERYFDKIFNSLKL
jgi:hypothetical protein